MNINKIPKGTVIDHIPPMEALRLMPLLKLESLPGIVSLGLNLPSGRMGKKDLIKVEDRFFTEEELNQIALFAPLATISIIDEGQVIKKFSVTLPPVIEEALACNNAHCITQSEPIKSRFIIHQRSSNLILNCDYCGTLCQL